MWIIRLQSNNPVGSRFLGFLCITLGLSKLSQIAAHRMATLKPIQVEAAAHRIHEEWMRRNPKQDWNAAQHVPYAQLPEEEKEKDRAHVRICYQLMLDTVRNQDEPDEAYYARIAVAFGAHAHEEWRRSHEAAKGAGTPRMKDVSDSKQQARWNGCNEESEVSLPTFCPHMFIVHHDC